jgi:hypothetical protein
MINLAQINQDQYLTYILQSRLDEFIALVLSKDVSDLTSEDWGLFIYTFDYLDSAYARSITSEGVNQQEVNEAVEQMMSRLSMERKINRESGSRRINYSNFMNKVVSEMYPLNHRRSSDLSAFALALESSSSSGTAVIN